MGLHLFRFLRPRPSRSRQPDGRRPAHGGVRFRPMVEAFEDRIVMSAAAVAPALGPALAAPAVSQATSLLPNLVQNVVASASGLLANVGLGGVTQAVPVALGLSPNQTGTTACPILQLQLNPINLNLLGLQVTTSAICLDITAMPGSGNVLGNLLCNVADLLNGGLSLSQILGGAGTGTLPGLTSTDISNLTTGLTNLLNQALGQVTSLTNALSGATVTSTGSTRILDLSLGPVNLNLLGLDVTLDNCNNGPVTVDITAQTGPGNLLGNLLGGLAHLLDSSAASGALLNKLDKIAGQILTLL